MKILATAALAITALAVQVPASAGQKPKKNDPTAIGDRNVSRGLNFYTLEQELALGKQLAIEVEKEAKIVDDPIVSEYINRIGQNLARNSDVTFPVTFKLIESDEINAFTLPGGYVFIDTALFKLSANEAELASAIAHEIGHAAGRHATRQASRNQLIGMGTIPLAIFGGIGGLAARQAVNLGEPMAFLKFSREFENEADLLGLQYLWKAGYDPTASIDLFEALESTERRQPGSVAKLFRTHPLTPDRIEKTQKNIDAILPSREQYVINTSEYEQVRARLQGLTQKFAEDSKTPILQRTPATQ
ncbi:MAG TPA: M48 family metallopeptidase [Bryobacteraceae bacterium]|nr:M48 family metallopeptidase [Bryobacteraceae bacterium]